LPQVRSGHEDLVQAVVFGFEVSHLIGRENRYSVLFSEECSPPKPPPAAHGPVVRKPYEHVLFAEGLQKTAKNLLCLPTDAGEDEVGEQPEWYGAGQADQTLCVLQEAAKGAERPASVF
jgi:hypothetical protein